MVKLVKRGSSLLSPSSLQHVGLQRLRFPSLWMKSLYKAQPCLYHTISVCMAFTCVDCRPTLSFTNRDCTPVQIHMFCQGYSYWLPIYSISDPSAGCSDHIDNLFNMKPALMGTLTLNGRGVCFYYVSQQWTITCVAFVYAAWVSTVKKTL